MIDEVVAVILARGGSKGVLRKNVSPFLGVPLVVHSIAHALAAKTVKRVVVSTDDKEIAEVSETAGAEVIWRPDSISGDTASSESALQHALQDLRESGSCEPDLIVFLQPTSPLRPTGAIDAAVAELIRTESDSLFSACRVHGFVWRQTGERLQSLTYDSAQRPRRQDIGDDWLENGSIYLFKPWVLDELDNRLGGKVSVFEMSPIHSYQIDEPGDILLMEDLAGLAKAGDQTSSLADIELLILDFDGVLTDNRVTIHQDGSESVQCSRGDGMGIELVRAAGVEVVVLSKERNPVVAARCRKLKIECLQGYDEKLPELKSLCRERNLRPESVGYMGNDVNDLGCMMWVGHPFAVADAGETVRNQAEWTSARQGGRGAVRDLCDKIIRDKVGR